MLAINRQALSDGIRDGIPIGLGYFVVSWNNGETRGTFSAARIFCKSFQ